MLCYHLQLGSPVLHFLLLTVRDFLAFQLFLFRQCHLHICFFLFQLFFCFSLFALSSFCLFNSAVFSSAFLLRSSAFANSSLASMISFLERPKNLLCSNLSNPPAASAFLQVQQVFFFVLPLLFFLGFSWSPLSQISLRFFLLTLCFLYGFCRCYSFFSLVSTPCL